MSANHAALAPNNGAAMSPSDADLQDRKARNLDAATHARIRSMAAAYDKLERARDMAVRPHDGEMAGALFDKIIRRLGDE